jgi:hypothetical protein
MFPMPSNAGHMITMHEHEVEKERKKRKKIARRRDRKEACKHVRRSARSKGRCRAQNHTISLKPSEQKKSTWSIADFV